IGKLGPTPAARRARSACASTGSAAEAARERARSSGPRPRPRSCSRSLSTSLVCLRPSSSKPAATFWASSVVIRPRETASASTSSIRSRVSITRWRGWMRFLRNISRSSAALLAETSLAGCDALSAVRLAWLRARCWRPRALPPLRAAVFRALDDPEELERLLAELLRADDPERLPPEDLLPLPPLLLPRPLWLLPRLSAMCVSSLLMRYPHGTISCRTRRRPEGDPRA